MRSDFDFRRPRILLTGAGGYVGGRLLERLELAGHRVRCLARRPGRVRRLLPSTDVVEGDLLRPDTLPAALQGVDIAYYLVHGMEAGPGFEDRDRQSARAFAAAARDAGVRRIVYLGGLGDASARLSPHLASRQEVGRLLGAGGVPVIEFRASVILGAGSLSYELIRALVERLPVMLCPSWVRVPTQPIAVDDVLDYLERALALPGEASRVYEIGGADTTTYAGLMQEYARQRGFRRLLVPLPVLTPALSGLWLGLVTPVVARVGRILVESIRHPTVVRDDGARRDFDVRPCGIREAMARAREAEEIRWASTPCSALLRASDARPTVLGVRAAGRLLDTRECRSEASPDEAFRGVERLGTAGWPYADGLWKFRRFFVRLFGRGPERWAVEARRPGRRLRLRADLPLPGRAWLEFEIAPDGDGCRLRQTAVFAPKGLAGLAYWTSLLPLHRVVFDGLIRTLARRRPCTC